MQATLSERAAVAMLATPRLAERAVQPEPKLGRKKKRRQFVK